VKRDLWTRLNFVGGVTALVSISLVRPSFRRMAWQEVIAGGLVPLHQFDDTH